MASLALSQPTPRYAEPLNPRPRGPGGQCGIFPASASGAATGPGGAAAKRWGVYQAGSNSSAGSRPLPQLLASRLESAHRAREPVALPAPSGDLGGAQKPGRALPAPNPLLGPSLAGPGSTAGLTSPLYESAEHWFGRDPLEPDEIS